MEGAPAPSDCWEQGRAFGRAVVGLSAVSCTTPRQERWVGTRVSRPFWRANTPKSGCFYSFKASERLVVPRAHLTPWDGSSLPASQVSAWGSRMHHSFRLPSRHYLVTGVMENSLNHPGTDSGPHPVIMLYDGLSGNDINTLVTLYFIFHHCEASFLFCFCWQ